MISQLRPTFIANRIEALTPEFIAEHDIRLVALDVDGLLTGYHSKTIDDSVVDMLQGIGEAGCKSVINSNAYDERAEEVHDLYGSYVNDVITPATVANGQNPRLFGKPNPAMLQYSMRTQGVSPEHTVMAGDQMFKDIWAANRAGVSSILVPRRGTQDHPGVRVQRIPEAVLRVAMGLPPLRRAGSATITEVDPLPQYAL